MTTPTDNTTTTRPRPWAGLSLMVDEDFARAALPLFVGEEVEVLEWSFDTSWGRAALPGWAQALIAQYAEQDRLLGHGINFSLLSATGFAHERPWLQALAGECSERKYRHISEHFGFAASGEFAEFAPLPTPLCPQSLRDGIRRLQSMHEAVKLPIGLENLALALGRDDVARQGEFLERLLDPVDGFLVLDLHNLYCQIENFGLDPQAHMASYPLHRVRELHLSGGSWSPGDPSQSDRIRRDTHDGPVPEAVFELLDLALARCPAVEAVILESLPGPLRVPGAAEQFRRDYRRMRAQVEAGATRLPVVAELDETHEAELDTLWQSRDNPEHWQTTLLELLRSSGEPGVIISQLRSDPELTSLRSHSDTLEPRMLHVARELFHSWARAEAGSRSP